jgi:hypothetical protein
VPCSGNGGVAPWLEMSGDDEALYGAMVDNGDFASGSRLAVDGDSSGVTGPGMAALVARAPDADCHGVEEVR